MAAQRYEVHSTTPPFYPPSFAFPNLPPPVSFYEGQWFPNTVGAPDPCGAEPEMLIGGGEEMRMRIAQGTGFESDYAANRLWQARRNIYDAIAAEAGSLSGAVQSFYQSNSAGLLGSLHAVEQGKRELFRLLPAARAQMAIHLADMKHLAGAIAVQDSLIAIEEGYVELRRNLLHDFSAAARTVDSLEHGILSARMALADSLQHQNNLLTGNAIYESNAIQVNDLYLDKPARGLADFTPAQIAGLESIAEQCPAAGGRTVWQARSLLALAGMEVDYPGECFEPQNQLTIPDIEIPAALDNLKALTVYPNPGHSVLNVACAEDFQPVAVLLVDLFGRVVYRKTWGNSVEIRFMEIDLSRLPAAIYQLIARDAEGIHHAVKVSIIR